MSFPLVFANMAYPQALSDAPSPNVSVDGKHAEQPAQVTELHLQNDTAELSPRANRFAARNGGSLLSKGNIYICLIVAG